MKILLFIYILLFFVLVFGLRSYLVYKQTGINPFKIRRDDSAQGFLGKIYSIVSLTIFLAVLVFTFLPQYYNYWFPISYLDNILLLKKIGIGSSIVALIWILIAQANMHNSWRIGIDEKEKTELIQNGLFQYSRNPIFLGILIAYWGFFLIIPNMFTFCAGILCYVSTALQIRLEEAYLEKQQGVIYLDYKQKVRRWL